MKVHVGVHVDSELIHTAGAMASSVHDAKVFDTLLPRDDPAVYDEKAYPSKRRRQPARRAGALWAMKEKGAARM